MNREIKFRAWVTKGKFIVHNEPYMATQGEPDLETLSSFMHHYSEEPLLMQYTGIPDKFMNGIYDGDILEVSDKMPITGTKYSNIKFKKAERYRVSFIEGCFYISKGKRHKHFQLKSILVRSNGLTIIGNIYENPELLNKK